MLTVIGKILGAIKDVVEWIGKIKIPKIDIPFVGGGSAPETTCSDRSKVSGVDGFIPVAARFGNVDLRLPAGRRRLARPEPRP